MGCFLLCRPFKTMALLRNIQALHQLGAALEQGDMDDSAFLEKPPRLIGSGSYNDILAVVFKGQNMVMRLSYYSPYTLSRIQALIRTNPPYKQLLQGARRITTLDPVQV